MGLEHIGYGGLVSEKEEGGFVLVVEEKAFHSGVRDGDST